MYTPMPKMSLSRCKECLIPVIHCKHKMTARQALRANTANSREFYKEINQDMLEPRRVEQKHQEIII